MARKRIFEPVISTLLKTDGLNHGEETEFKLSYGFELENVNPVFKVQMVQDGLIKGRQAPSYSEHDFEKIVSIRKKLKYEFDKTDKRLRDLVLDELI